MSNVVPFPPPKDHATLALLRALKIGAANGDIVGLEVVVRLRSGGCRTFTAGAAPAPHQASHLHLK